jgi:hypothetical protein
MPQGHAHGILDRPGADLVDPVTPWRQPEKNTTGVEGVAGPNEEPARLEAPKDARQRARVRVQHRGQVTGRDARELPDQTDDEPLGPSHTKMSGHMLRSGFEAVIDLPQQSQEL